MLRLLALLLVFSVAIVPAPAAPPQAPAPRPVLDPLADWTPRPATGIAEEWEKAIEANWIDARFREMNTGPFLNCTMRYPLGKDQPFVYKATVVKLGEKGDAGVVFDRCTMRLCAAWTGGYLNHSDRRFGLMNTPTPKGEMVFAAPARAGVGGSEGKWVGKPTLHRARGPCKWVKYRGHVRSRRPDRVQIRRRLNRHRGPCISVPTARHRGQTGDVDSIFDAARTARSGPSGQMRGVDDRSPASRARFEKSKDLVRRRKPTRLVLLVHRTAAMTPGRPKFAKDALRRRPHYLLTKGGPKRWGEPIVTKLVRGDDSGPFAIDTLTIPYKNRFNALFFCTGLDHLPDGRIAVCTCHGDVWLVTRRRESRHVHLAALRDRPLSPARPQGRRRQGRRARTRPTDATARPQQRRRGRLLRVRVQRLGHRPRRTFLRHLPRNRPAGQLLLLQDRRHRICPPAAV